MHISTANIGQIICLDHGSQLIQIEDVSDQVVTYRKENGYRYGTYKREVLGHIVEDPVRIQEFERNYELGNSLNAAEQKALRDFLSAVWDKTSRDEAAKVLNTVRTQQEHLDHRIKERCLLDARDGRAGTPVKEDSLDLKIRQAAEKKVLQGPVAYSSQSVSRNVQTARENDRR